MLDAVGQVGEYTCLQLVNGDGGISYYDNTNDNLKFILASQVGEAARVLPDNMLVPYDGDRDLQYPQKLAARIRSLLAQGTKFGFRPESVEIAKQYFDYDFLAAKYGDVIQKLLLANVST